jgi:hypothetical protein
VGEKIFPITYLPSISNFASMLRAEKIVFDKHEHFVKQTFRNRSLIYSANGLLQLIIPVGHKDLYRIPIHEVKISCNSPWNKIHWRSIESAYRKSAYFEYFEAELKPFFDNPTEKLFDFNFILTEKLFSLMRIPFNYGFTSAYEKNMDENSDYRSSLISYDRNPNLPFYQQVFSDRHEFIPDLSILDLLFNKGMESKMYLDSVRPLK